MLYNHPGKRNSSRNNKKPQITLTFMTTMSEANFWLLLHCDINPLSFLCPPCCLCIWLPLCLIYWWKILSSNWAAPLNEHLFNGTMTTPPVWKSTKAVLTVTSLTFAADAVIFFPQVGSTLALCCSFLTFQILLIPFKGCNFAFTCVHLVIIMKKNKINKENEINAV